jgi:hypothetical protein
MSGNYQGPLGIAPIIFEAKWRKLQIEACLEEELAKDPV